MEKNCEEIPWRYPVRDRFEYLKKYFVEKNWIVTCKREHGRRSGGGGCFKRMFQWVQLIVQIHRAVAISTVCTTMNEINFYIVL